ncbi:MAG TPA: TetR/AcrR family transcriptional regulator [Mobilitalea sp.]|nr:TetR/AcrR family transcriptional regulator [Mobilitalea sp.]
MDRRTLKTQIAIRDTFIALLKERSIHQITVAEITRRANLGRGTFYLHYKDVYDLYELIQNNLFTELEQLFNNAYPSFDPVNLMELTNTLTTYLDKNREIILLIIQTEDNGKVLQKLKTFFSNKVLWEDPSLYTSEYDVVESMFIVAGVIGVLEEWLKSGMGLTQLQIAAMLKKILIKFVASDVIK